ncbi:MAG TPA: flavin reductase family protein [Ensifer sp.]|nr:flavin reductase family protein [Ensifer sp.]
MTINDPDMNDAFRKAMRSFAGNVSVITVGEGEERSGLVATSTVSLSVEPATMLVCVNRAASSRPLFARYRHFGVNALRPDQKAIAERFSGKDGVKGAERYALGTWHAGETGAPLLQGAAVAIDCEIEDMIEWTTHSILIGRVRSVEIGDASAALVYWQGAYRPLMAENIGFSRV